MVLEIHSHLFDYQCKNTNIHCFKHLKKVNKLNQLLHNYHKIITTDKYK